MKTIKLTEQDLELIVKKVLKEQTGPGITSFTDLTGSLNPKSINPNNLKIGSRDKPNDTNGPVHKLQQSLMDLGYLKTKSMVPTGYFGNLTQNALDRYYNSKGEKKKSPEKTKDSGENIKSGGVSTPCVGLPKELCSKISTKDSVALGSGGEAQCAAYVTKCLSQYDKDFRTGNAWKSASWLAGGGGSEKFNLFKTNVDWSKIWEGLKSNKITKSDCMAFYGKQSSDVGTFKPKSKAILNLTQNNAPDSSGAEWRKLKPGDVVGLWHQGTTNSGRAFCERLVDDLKLDDKGNFKELPFTFNTHVGFVTAIKDGIPIIAHNVGNSFHTSGTYSAVPVTKMLSKSSPDRVVWAYSDPQVERSVEKILNKDPKNYFSNFNLNK